MELPVAPNVEAETGAIMGAALRTLMGLLAHPLTPAVGVWLLCSGMRHNYPFGGSRVTRSLRMFTIAAQTLIAGEPPSPVGLTSLVTSKTRSGICKVCSIDVVPSNIDVEKYPIPSPQWLSTSQFVVTGLDPLTTTVVSRELAQRPSQTHLTTIVRLFSRSHD